MTILRYVLALVFAILSAFWQYDAYVTHSIPALVAGALFGACFGMWLIMAILDM